MGIPLPRGDAQIRLGIGQDGLRAFQSLEGLGTSDECAGHASEPFITFPVMALPFVPHALGVVIHALPAEEVAIQAGVTLFFVLQALQHELQVCFGQWHRLCLSGSLWLASELDDLTMCMRGAGLATAGNGACNGSRTIGFPAACRTIPLLWTVQRRTTKQPIDLRGIFVRPEGKQMAEGEIGF